MGGRNSRPLSSSGCIARTGMGARDRRVRRHRGLLAVDGDAPRCSNHAPRAAGFDEQGIQAIVFGYRGGSTGNGLRLHPGPLARSPIPASAFAPGLLTVGVSIDPGPKRQLGGRAEKSRRIWSNGSLAEADCTLRLACGGVAKPGRRRTSYCYGTSGSRATARSGQAILSAPCRAMIAGKVDGL